MIKNDEILSDKFKELARKVYCYFDNLKIGDVQAKAMQHMNVGYPYVEYTNQMLRLVFYYSPEEVDREEQLHVTNIFFDNKIRHKGYFSGLMEVLKKWREENSEVSILFEQVVSPNLKEILVNKYDGAIACDDGRGCFIFAFQ